MVARLKLTRQRSHRVEVAWQVKTNKTQFHRYSFFAVQFIDKGELIATARAADFSLLPMSRLQLPRSIDEVAQPSWGTELTGLHSPALNVTGEFQLFR